MVSPSIVDVGDQVVDSLNILLFEVEQDDAEDLLLIAEGGGGVAGVEYFEQVVDEYPLSHVLFVDTVPHVVHHHVSED